MPGPKVLSQRALEGLRAYKYKPGGYTWLDHLHTPFWNCEQRHSRVQVAGPAEQHVGLQDERLKQAPYIYTCHAHMQG